MEAAHLIFNSNQKFMVSHRSGETCNSDTADLAVGNGAQYIKIGSTARREHPEIYQTHSIYDYLREHNMLDSD